MAVKTIENCIFSFYCHSFESRNDVVIYEQLYDREFWMKNRVPFLYIYGASFNFKSGDFANSKRFDAKNIEHIKRQRCL